MFKSISSFTVYYTSTYFQSLYKLLLIRVYAGNCTRSCYKSAFFPQTQFKREFVKRRWIFETIKIKIFRKLITFWSICFCTLWQNPPKRARHFSYVEKKWKYTFPSESKCNRCTCIVALAKVARTVNRDTTRAIHLLLATISSNSTQEWATTWNCYHPLLYTYIHTILYITYIAHEDRKKFYEEEAAKYKTALCLWSSFQYFQATKKLVTTSPSRARSLNIGIFSLRPGTRNFTPNWTFSVWCPIAR